MLAGIMEWVCEICHSKMIATRVGDNKWEIRCPKCGSTWYVDDNGDYIN